MLVRLPLARIHFRFDWNARSEAAVLGTVARDGQEVGYDAERDGTGLGDVEGRGDVEPGLIGMILAQGQLQPIDARPSLDPAWVCEAVDGHRRGAALAAIAEAAIASKVAVESGGKPHAMFLELEGMEKPAAWKTFDWLHPIVKDPDWNAVAPSARVLLREMTEVEARTRNLNAGTSGAHLSTPDLAFGVAELQKAVKAAGGKFVQGQVGRQIGKSGTHVCFLLRVMTLPNEVTSHWRKGGMATIAGQRVVSLGPLGLQDMHRIALMDGDDFDKAHAYATAVMRVAAVKRTRGNKTEEDKKEAALVQAKKRAVRFGKLLAWARFADVHADSDAETWLKIVDDFVHPKTRDVGTSKKTDRGRARAAVALRESFQAEEAKLLAKGSRRRIPGE